MKKSLKWFIGTTIKNIGQKKNCSWLIGFGYRLRGFR